MALDLDQHALLIQSAMDEAVAAPLIEAEPFPVTSAQLTDFFTQAHRLGLRISRDVGDEAYHKLHAE